ncbi:MAG: hypothetical protein ACLGJC_09600 [Alphaproteobacteria bacterium]
MAETITPEQRAEAIIPSGVFPEQAAADMRAAIASAIRAAVEAERARCAQFARQSDKGQDLTGDELADLILATEADNVR